MLVVGRRSDYRGVTGFPGRRRDVRSPSFGVVNSACTSLRHRGKGSGRETRGGDGQWVASVSFGYDANGKRQRKTVYGATKREAQDKLDELNPAARAGTLSTSVMSTRDFLKLWLNTVKGKVSAGTFSRYEQLANDYLIPGIGSVKLANLRPLHVEQCYASLTRETEAGPVAASQTTRRAAGVVLGIALRHAVRLKMIPHNPARDVSKPRVAARESAFMTPMQGRRFLGANRAHRLHPLYATALGTGLRQGELLALKWPDIDFEAGTVTVRRSLSQVGGRFELKEPKSKTSRRTIAVPEFVLAILREHRLAALAAGWITAPVFCSTTGTYLGRGNLLRAFATSVKAARVDASDAETIPMGLRFHDLRHSHASCLIASGSSIKAMSRRLGHADITVTLKVYSHCLPDDDAKLAAGADSLFKAIG